MFRVMRNSSAYGTADLLDRFIQALRTLVPLGTLNRLQYERSRDVAWDASIRWDVGSSSVLLAVEVKVVASKLEPGLLPQRPEGAIPVLVAPFIPKRVQRALEGAGWSYWDATGNVLLLSTAPFIAVRLQGADKDPEPAPQESTRLRSLKGRATSEVMVCLLQNGGRTGSLRDFAREYGLPLGTVSRVVSLLREENFLEPTGGGPIVLTDRLEVARRWAEDYSFSKTFHARRYFSLNGPELALQRIIDSGVDYAVTGVRAAQSWLNSTSRVAGLPARETWVYVSDLPAVERAADLAVDARDGQIVVAEAKFLGREFIRPDSGVRYAAPWRTVGDLLSSGGRLANVGENLAEDLIRQWP